MQNVTLVYAATGVQGGAVARELMRRGERVRVLVRTPGGAAHLAQQGAEVMQGDLHSEQDVHRAFEGVTQASLTFPVGSDALSAVRLAVQAARDAGIRRLVVNTSGMTPARPTGEPSLDYRLELEQTVQGSGLPHVILRPTTYLQNLLGPWVWPSVISAGVLSYPLPELHRVSWLDAEDLGPLTAEALSGQVASGVIKVGGPEALTGPELAAQVGRHLGRDVQYQALLPEAFGAALGAVFGPDMGAATTRAYRHTWQDSPDALTVPAQDTVLHLPVALTSVAGWLERLTPGADRQG
ncbi:MULTISPECIES: SDR family oxidoreductase [unclassified Deinococcus]|uniref:SDR family oxidoreductase n=1 Tax=unclassified Deinococcus TaxID=2623546 RepID=UPI001E61B011|nr:MULTISPECIES: NmrA family NAD(P)-binding protein [unclassified Deinococcus]MCD0160366.1 NmrA family NAD(P)-binding protein [Deinococcus sp. 6YEL10]MCD0168896.1 NmrA family NAD(P)-binding protein [Deinococcus sp. 23YEL01]MCD0174902.1 NmrA family NAD(P)-binding protein [Deinococcus sp. 14RED07]